MKLTQIGFYWKGQFITDPLKEETGRFEVNPYFYYGRHYLNSPFFDNREDNLFEVIHTAPNYPVSIVYVGWNYFCEENGFDKESIHAVGRLIFEGKILIDDDNIVVTRMI